LSRIVASSRRRYRHHNASSVCFHTAERTLEGVATLNMMRKGQVKRLDQDDDMGQAKFVRGMFGLAA
jgi:hypothetical protein